MNIGSCRGHLRDGFGQIIASAAAVAYIEEEALAIARAVGRDHRLEVEQRLEPACAISGWYGV